MPRYDNLPLEQLETIRKVIEESDTIDAANPAELDDPRALVEMHWPHLLHKLPPHTGISDHHWASSNRGTRSKKARQRAGLIDNQNQSYQDWVEYQSSTSFLT